MYTYAAFDPRNISAAIATNDQVFADAPVGVYGVEVTVPALASQCALGNLDPQHTGGQNLAACVAALSYPLPPAGATLATVRADADSVLAMAVLELRANGAEGWDVAKVAVIGNADSAQVGPWRRDYTPPVEFSQVNAVAMNHRIPLAERVATLIDWLNGSGQLPPARPPVDRSIFDVTLSGCGRYVVVGAEGAAGAGACGEGYRHAPVVIAINNTFQLRGGEPHLKYTIARWNNTVDMDWMGMVEDLNSLETGWGGTSSIVGSPQGVGSTLTLDQVKEILTRHL